MVRGRHPFKGPNYSYFLTFFSKPLFGREILISFASSGRKFVLYMKEAMGEVAGGSHL